MAQRKGAQKVGGRQKGTPNKVTADLKALTQVHTTDAVAKLVKLMNKGESEQVQFAAAKELLDRAHGKAPQATTISGDKDNPLTITQIVRKIVDHADDPNR